MHKALLYSLIFALTIQALVWCHQVDGRSVTERRVVQHYTCLDSLIAANDMSANILQQKVEKAESITIWNRLITTFLILLLLILLIFQQYKTQQIVRQQNRIIAQQKKMMYTAVCSQEHEYRRMADELHNGVGALLSAIKLNINNVNLQLNHFCIQTEVISETRSLIDLAIGNVRGISKKLSPATLEVFGLGQALEELLQRISVETPIATEWVLDKQRNVLSLETEFAFYRIVRELLFNSIQYPIPKKIFLELISRENRLYLKLQIDAQAIHFAGQPKELSVDIDLDRHNIESRLAMINGKIEKYNSTGYCHKITLSLPIKKTLAA